jgi:hypothetical protein
LLGAPYNATFVVTSGYCGLEIIVCLRQFFQNSKGHTNDNLFIAATEGTLEGVPAGKELLMTGVAGLDAVGVERVFLDFGAAGEFCFECVVVPLER